MPRKQVDDDKESQPLTEDSYISSRSSPSSAPHRPSSSTASTISLIFEHLAGNGYAKKIERPYRDNKDSEDSEGDGKNQYGFEELDIEEADFRIARGVNKKYKKWLFMCGAICLTAWVATLFLFIYNGAYIHRSALEHDPEATKAAGRGKKITISQLESGEWRPESQDISWISGPNGEDGLVLERGGHGGRDYLTVEDIRGWGDGSPGAMQNITLMKEPVFSVHGNEVLPDGIWPSPNLKMVLCMSERKHNWRHSYTGLYWLFDVESQTGQPLDPSKPMEGIQVASWSPSSEAVVFTRDNNMFLRNVGSDEVIQITQDGGEEMFNGVPDWVYEEEVFSGNSATWWSPEGNYIAFLATNETGVPEYPVQYFMSRPSGQKPEQGLENYPEVRQIKYPKAGAPNPVVHLRFYDVKSDSTFEVSIEDDFNDSDRLITEVIWARNGKVLVRQTNRESDLLKMVLVDVENRQGRVVRERDVQKLDGGWFEISETTTFVPADQSRDREHDGYIDTVIHEGYDHLAYFTPLDNPEPLMLTSGHWEVEAAPSAVDLQNNLVYFIGTKDGSIQRHVYKVSLDGSGLEAITDRSKDGYYSASFSKAAGYALLSYHGPKIPWQKVISTSGNTKKLDYLIEENKNLASMASQYELPIKVYDTVNVDGYEFNVVERRPTHFDKKKKYPVLFFLYGGPGSQMVDKRFSVDYQSYVASTLGYIVVTMDGRGTGFLGREARTIVRGNLGYWEAYDQIATAKIWAKKKYVDETRIAIWGWSYGGYMTLKTLEQDAGQTFRYGMAVAPVTDWQFYDSIYTERYMHSPQRNPEGYQNASVSNVTAIAQNVRWLIMHGVSDDNVHFQNTLTLLDEFDLAGVENYDVHVFPDSDHSIFFHGARRVVYDKLTWWLINAFNGEWERIATPVPLRAGQQVGTTDGKT